MSEPKVAAVLIECRYCGHYLSISGNLGRCTNPAENSRGQKECGRAFTVWTKTEEEKRKGKIGKGGKKLKK